MKCAHDKLRFELTLYGFLSKEETDLIISIVWRSWRSYYCISYYSILLIYSGSNLMLSSSGLIAHSVAFHFAKFMEVVEVIEVVSVILHIILYISRSMKYHILSTAQIAHL